MITLAFNNGLYVITTANLLISPRRVGQGLTEIFISYVYVKSILDLNNTFTCIRV